MKKLLVALGLVLSINAHAETWVMPNTGGGEITLTNRVCEYNGKTYDNLRRAYSWTKQIYFDGCWSVIDGNVHVVWNFSDGTSERRVYQISHFTRRP